MAGLSFYSLSSCILHVLLVHYCQSRLIGPNQPIIATAGEDITLQCHLVPGENVAAMTLEWTRPDLDTRFVFLWRAGQDLINMKNPSYKGRSSLFTDELKHGNISLKLYKVKPADEGRYRCHIPDKNEEAFIDLVVASSAVSSPVISLEGIDRDKTGVVLECKSEGWHPKPELLWLDGEGNLLSAGPAETLRGPDDLYTVSSRVTVEKRHSNNITCRVQQRNTNQSRETHIHVPEDFFEIPSSSSAVIIGLAVSLALCIILLILSAVVLLRRKRKHVMKNNRSPEDHTDGEGAKVLLGKTEGGTQNTSSSSTKTKKQTSCLPITSRRKLLEEQERREEAEKNLQDIKAKLSGNISQAQEEKQKMEREMERLRNELDSTKQQLQQEKKAAENLKKELEEKNRELEKNTEFIKQLQEVKVAVEDLKKHLENKNPEMIRSENDEIIQKLTDILPILVSKLQQEKKAAENLKKQLEYKNRELSGNISQAEKEKQKMERLRNELDSRNQQSEKKTETINQLKQEKKAAEKLKNQFKSKCHEMINSEREKNEIIQKLMKIFPTLDSKLQSEKITENIKQQLQQVKDRVEKLKNQLEKKSHEIFKSETELDKFIQKVLQTFPTLDSKLSESISQHTEGVKQAAENLKAELEFRSREMINSEKEKDGIIQKLMKTFSTMDSKCKKNTDIIEQLVQVKQKAEGLKKQLKPQTHEWTEKTETIHQLQQLEQAAETLKIQLESKNQQMIKSDKIIQKLMKIFPALDSEWKKNTEIINQLQEVKETAEKLKQMEKKNQELQGETDSNIIKQLQEAKETAEKLKNQLESKNWEMLQAEKRRNDETDRKLKELVKQLEEKKKKTEKNLNELVKMLEDEKKKTEENLSEEIHSSRQATAGPSYTGSRYYQSHY